MIKIIIPHICIILALVTLTFFILIQYNPGIFNSDFFSVIVYIFCGVAIITSALLIAYNRRAKN